MVIGYCGKVRNTGIDPDAIAQTWRDRVYLQAHGSAAAGSSAPGCQGRAIAYGKRRTYADARGHSLGEDTRWVLV